MSKTTMHISITNAWIPAWIPWGRYQDNKSSSSSSLYREDKKDADLSSKPKQQQERVYHLSRTPWQLRLVSCYASDYSQALLGLTQED